MVLTIVLADLHEYHKSVNKKNQLKDQDQLTSFMEMANFEIKPAKANFDPVRMKCPCTGSDLGLDSESEELPVLKGEPEGDNWGP